MIAPLWLHLMVSADAAYLASETTIWQRLHSVVGIAAIVGIAWLMSERRGRVNWRTVAFGLGIQLVIGLVILNPAVAEVFYNVINAGVNELLGFADRGAAFIFSSMTPHMIADADGVLQPVTGISPPVRTFAFVILPTIIFFSALMGVMYHLGIMQMIVRVIAAVMVRTMGTSGAESLSAAGNIFVGQTEAPLLVRPFIQKMTRSELMAIMTGGFATVAGGVLGAYIGFLKDGMPDIGGHLVMASLMAAPGALALAKVVVPETAEPETAGELEEMPRSEAGNLVEAVAIGASDGVKLAINVAAMLIAIVALVNMVDYLMGVVPLRFCGAEEALSIGYTCGTEASRAVGLADMLAVVFAPLAWIMGIPWGEATVVGRLLGEKLVLTEFVAYGHLGDIINGTEALLSERSATMAAFALCGFANFASIGIQLGGIGGMAPERMGDLSSLGLKAMLTGALATCLAGTVAGVFV